MNKTELIASISEKSGLTKVDSKKALEAFMETVKEQMHNKQKVSLVGFGSFTVTHKAERKGVNPKTRSVITIPAKDVVKFKPGTELELTR